MPAAPAAWRDAEQACARLAQAFVVHLDAGRYDAVADLFMPDGTLHRVSGERLNGRMAIAQGLRRPQGQIVIHHASPVHVEPVGAEDAMGVSSFLALSAIPGESGPPMSVAAVWHDHYRLVQGIWRIAERRAETRLRDWASATPHAGQGG